MSALGFFLGLACLVTVITSCIVPEKKKDQEVHVFHFGDSKDSANDEPDIIELHIPGGKHKRETPKSEENALSCENDEDCPPSEECILKTSKCQASSKSIDSKIESLKVIHGNIRVLIPTI